MSWSSTSTTAGGIGGGKTRRGMHCMLLLGRSPVTKGVYFFEDRCSQDSKSLHSISSPWEQIVRHVCQAVGNEFNHTKSTNIVWNSFGVMQNSAECCSRERYLITSSFQFIVYEFGSLHNRALPLGSWRCWDDLQNMFRAAFARQLWCVCENSYYFRLPHASLWC